MKRNKISGISESIIQDERNIKIFFLIFIIIALLYTLVSLLVCSIDYSYGGILVCLIMLFSIEFPLLIGAILLIGSDKYRFNDTSIQNLFFKRIIYEVRKESIYAIVYGHSMSMRGRFGRNQVPTIYIILLPSNQNDTLNELYNFDLKSLYPSCRFYMFLESNEKVLKIKNVQKKYLYVLTKNGYKYINCYDKK